MILKDKIKNTKLFNKLKETEIYWKIKNKLNRNISAHIFLTLQCNLNCQYCVNQANPKESKIKKYIFSPGEKWVSAINRMKKSVILTGGEPTLHPDFIKIVNNINKKIPIIIYTNFCWKKEFLNKFIKELRRPVKIFGSYHPSGGKPEKVLEVISTLKQKGLFDGMIHSVGTKQQKEFLENTARSFFKKHNLFLTIDKDQFEFLDAAGCSMKFRKKVHCSGKNILIAPDGTRFQCVSKMLRMVDPQENIFKERLRKDMISSRCPDYGFCSPCDMGFKIKPIN